MRTFKSRGLVALGALLSLGTAVGVSAQPAASPAQPTTAAGSAAPSVASGKPTTPSSASAAPAASAAAPVPVAPKATEPAGTDPLAGSTDPYVPLASAQVHQASVAPPAPAGAAQSLDALRTEVESYEKSAKEYRDSMTSVIRLHYETKKKEVLAGLDEDIAIEVAERNKARNTAIERLEAFVAAYSGSRAHPEATPDAMFRLAALYEERGRGEEGDLPEALKPAIKLYKRIVTEYPKYKELAAVYYFLGHAYNDAGRVDESQNVWRSLVCNNKYPYDPAKEDPKKPGHDVVLPMPQDNDENYWTSWRQRYSDAKFLKPGGQDVTFSDPFPKECTPLAQPSLLPGQEPKYVPEIWWQIGNWEFDQLDFASGYVRDEAASVYGFNRAASAYQHAMQFKKPPIYGVALYKYAWTLFKQQRYASATKEFVKLLNYTDQQQALTGDPGADFRTEAYTYIAGSLANVDFEGPGADDPYIQRPDIIETEPRAEVAEKKLHVGVDRVKDPAIIPQDKSWTIDIYKALANEYRTINQFSNAIEVYETILAKYPMHPSAPEVQAAISETYDQMNFTRKPGTPEFEATAAKALEARTKLSNYIGNTPWVDANKENPGAIRTAERLVKGGLRQAAATHTNQGRSAFQTASDTADPVRQLEFLQRASQEYKLAAVGWRGYLLQDENAPDAYESRYWLADSLRWYARIQVFLHKAKPAQFAEPTKEDLANARSAAVVVRDSNEDDKYLGNGAFFVVDVSDIDRDLAYARFETSGGSEGIEGRKEVKFTSEGDDRKVVKDPIPPVVVQSMQARDEYVVRVPAKLDDEKRALSYVFYAGETNFLYGQFEEARKRFEPMYRAECGKSDYGYRAWEKLITMSNLEHDVERSRQLAEAEKNHPCAISEADKAKEGLIVNPTLQEASYVKARAKFKEAQDAPPGPKKNQLWLEAAALYEAALSAAPGRDEAPEAAMNAAYAYKQVGDFAKAIELYNKFINEYGNEERLSRLEKGDPKTKAAPEPKKYTERLGYLKDAYNALGTTYYSFFNYQRAAETYEKVANNPRFDLAMRKTTARNAMILFANMGQRDKMLATYKVVIQLQPTADEKANADYLVASYDYKQWDSKGGDTGQNRSARLAAESSLTAFYNSAKANPAAAKYALESAYFVAKMKKTVGDAAYRTWFKTTIAAWESFKARAPQVNGKSEALAAPYVDYAAEADFTLVDEQVHASYETDGKHVYATTVEDMFGKFDDKTKKYTSEGRYTKNAKEADKWDRELERVVKTYPSQEWVPAALARQGSIWDTLRTGLYNATKVKLFTPQVESILTKMENSGRPDLEDKAGAIRDAVRDGYRGRRDREIEAADTVMVRHYASAFAFAKKANVRNTQVEKAVRRLAYFTDIIGDAKLKVYVEGTIDPTDPTKKLEYRDGLYLQSRPGQSALPANNGNATSLPVAP